MLDPYTTSVFLSQRLKESIAEAQNQKLVEIALSGRNPDKPFYYDTLAALGRRLCSWGEHLQTRYSPVEMVIVGEGAQ